MVDPTKKTKTNVSELSKQLLDQLLTLYHLCWEDMVTYEYDDQTGIILDINDVKKMDECCVAIKDTLSQIKKIAPDKAYCTCVVVRKRDCPFHMDRQRMYELELYGGPMDGAIHRTTELTDEIHVSYPERAKYVLTHDWAGDPRKNENGRYIYRFRGLM